MLTTPTRRTFTALLASLPLALKTFAADHNMFLALNSVLINSRVRWPEFAKLAANVGYPGTDVMLDAAMKAGLSSTNDLLSQLKIKPAAINFPVEFRKDDAAFQAGLVELRKSAPFAKAIGCPRMVTYIMPSSNTPKEELRALYQRRFTEAAKILAHSDVRLGLEFLGPLHLRHMFPIEFIWRMNDMLEFANSCGPNVGLLLDSWHWYTAGATVQDIIHAGKKNIVHVHFNDAPKLPPAQLRDNHRLLPGEGVINLTGFLQALHKIGYTDALSVEVFGRLDDVPPEQAAQMGLRASVEVFKKAGVPQG
jgi:sugar phosphate isomerase/epimerase